ncbi:MAG: glutamine synthetase family protein [Candidatus Magasanikbacteria bacterium]
MEKNITSLKSFLEISYEQLEELNLKALDKMGDDPKILEQEYVQYLKKEKSIKAVTLCFTDIEGRFQMLDYDKKYLLGAYKNFTFDGSSIRGFSAQHESDLRLAIDWSSFRWLPADVFGPGKIVVFASILNQDFTPHSSDMRGLLKTYAQALKKKDGITVNVAAEIEGFLVDGVNAEQQFDETAGFKFVTAGGYYHSLPLDRLRVFIDKVAEAQRSMGFQNEKDHPEVAPSQFEMNYSYTEVVRACDNIQLYKLVCRQVANTMGLTATFLPKPAANINGSGMHTNISMSKNGKNIFYQKNGVEGLSATAWEVIMKLLNHAPELCLILNSSVNSYRRLDPAFEAPNQIKVSSKDRGSMIRIPIGNENSTRLELRSVAPDANPYMIMFAVLKTAAMGKKLEKDKDKRDRLRFLPGNIHDAIKLFKASDFTEKILGADAKEKYLALKQAVADRSPKELGAIVKKSEIVYHHEVTNQLLWNRF